MIHCHLTAPEFHSDLLLLSVWSFCKFSPSVSVYFLRFPPTSQTHASRCTPCLVPGVPGIGSGYTITQPGYSSY